MSRSLVDTDIFSEILRGRNSNVAARLKAYVGSFDRYAVSTVTIAEVVRGCHKMGWEGRVQEAIRLATAADIIVLDFASSVLAGRILGDLERTGQPIGLADCPIAAIAVTHGLRLVTGNTAHYQRVQRLGYGLALENWREPVL